VPLVAPANFCRVGISGSPASIKNTPSASLMPYCCIVSSIVIKNNNSAGERFLNDS
jgi:hypothetical protein